MKASYILIILVIGLIGGSLLFFPNEQEVKSSSALSADSILYDFGEIDIYGGKVTTEFLLTNEGDEDIVITGGTTSCGCTEAEIAGIGISMHENMSEDFTIPAGESSTLTVVYDPLAHGPSGVGLAQRSVFLETNSSATPVLEVRIKALVVDNS